MSRCPLDLASEPSHCLSRTLNKALPRLWPPVELARPGARFTETSIRSRIARWLSVALVGPLLWYQLELPPGRPHLELDLDQAAFER